jgi:hypothetical protein
MYLLTFSWDIPLCCIGSQNIGKIHNLYNVSMTKMFLRNLSQRHVSGLSWAIFRSNAFLCEVNHTINIVTLLLSARSHVTSITFIHLKLVTVTVELKCYYNIKDIKEQGIIIMEGEWGCQNWGIFCVTMLVFSLVILQWHNTWFLEDAVWKLKSRSLRIGCW